MSAAQIEAAKQAGERAYAMHLASRPGDYSGAMRAAADAQTSHLLALHGSGKWE